MMSRLVFPLGFLISLIALAFVMQTLGGTGSTSTTSTNNSPDALRQFEIVPIDPPPLSLTDQDGQAIKVDSLTAQPTLVTFWSVECGECEVGLPILENFAKSQGQIKVVLIAVKNDPTDVAAKLKSLEIDLPNYFDRAGQTFADWEATMPASYFITSGQVRYFFGGRVSNEHLQALLTII